MLLRLGEVWSAIGSFYVGLSGLFGNLGFGGSGTSSSGSSGSGGVLTVATTKAAVPATPAPPTTCLTTPVASCATSAQAEIVNKHNALRGYYGLNSTCMAKMIWDPELAALAQCWANQCTLGHPASSMTQYYMTSKFSQSGQNGAFGYTSWTTAIQDWYDEIDKFTYGGNNQLGDVGHYTQVIWSSSYAVGCGCANCPNTQFKTYYFCNYGLPGNYNLRQPYIKGTQCSACTLAGDSCDATTSYLCSNANGQQPCPPNMVYP